MNSHLLRHQDQSIQCLEKNKKFKSHGMVTVQRVKLFWYLASTRKRHLDWVPVAKNVHFPNTAITTHSSPLIFLWWFMVLRYLKVINSTAFYNSCGLPTRVKGWASPLGSHTPPGSPTKLLSPPPAPGEALHLQGTAAPMGSCSPCGEMLLLGRC